MQRVTPSSAYASALRSACDLRWTGRHWRLPTAMHPNVLLTSAGTHSMSALHWQRVRTRVCGLAPGAQGNVGLSTTGARTRFLLTEDTSVTTFGLEEAARRISRRSWLRAPCWIFSMSSLSDTANNNFTSRVSTMPVSESIAVASLYSWLILFSNVVRKSSANSSVLYSDPPSTVALKSSETIASMPCKNASSSASKSTSAAMFPSGIVLVDCASAAASRRRLRMVSSSFAK